MSKIVDRRQQKTNKKAEDRKKFLERNKRAIKEAADRVLRDTKIKDQTKQDRDISIPSGPLDEPTFHHDQDTGTKHKVYSGNDRLSKGDRLPKPKKGEGSNRKAGNSGEGDDDFEFALTRQEFLDIVFEDMALPNYVKESIAKDTKFKWTRAGYTTEGPINRLNLKKTFMQALARKLAFRGARSEDDKDKKIPFLEEVDLRYNLFKKNPFPVKRAVMFCIMDVSGSMTEGIKDIAKRFFILLYLFLDRNYDMIDVRFIRHTTEAKEVDEREFFYSRETGGTMVSKAFVLMDEIIKKDYGDGTWNIYASQASDGDNWPEDNADLTYALTEKILPAVQYMAYIQIAETEGVKDYFSGEIKERDLLGTLYHVYHPLEDSHTNFHTALVYGRDSIFPVLRGLFKKHE